VPELDTEQWAEDYASPTSQESFLISDALQA